MSTPSLRSSATSSVASTVPPLLGVVSRAQCPSPKEVNVAQTVADGVAQPSEAVLEKILELEEIDTNMFRGYSPAAPRWGRIYGGQTVAQALVACCRTVEPQFVVHSLHAYFLRPGNDDLPIMYYVERLRNGRSFASRRVTAMQKGSAIFAMMASFMTEEKGREHQDEMPKVPPPESVKGLADTYRDVLKNPNLSPRIRKGLERSLALPFAVDLRRVQPASLEERLKPQRAVHRSWMRVQGKLSDSLIMHQCALAYMSDWSLLETTLLPHGLHGWISGKDQQSLQMASIDHTIHFHHPFRADEWVLYDMDSPAASGGRGFARGRFFDREGKLLVSTSQEGLIRVHQGPPPMIRPVGSKEKEKNSKTSSTLSASATSKPTDTSFNAKTQIKSNL